MAKKNNVILGSARIAQLYEDSHIALEEFGVQVQIPAGLLPFFFVFFLVFFLLSSVLPLGLFPFILTADPF